MSAHLSLMATTTTVSAKDSNRSQRWKNFLPHHLSARVVNSLYSQGDFLMLTPLVFQPKE
jgi:hypothetical protein